MKTILETQRLLLRELTADDFDALYEVLSDSDITAHYPYNFDEARVRRWIERNIERYKEDGFGLWAVILRDTGALIGDCGITMQNINGQLLPEVGYHIHKAYQRRGYASEAAAGCMKYAFETLGFDKIYSYMKYTNEASCGVALKNGMKLIEEYPDPENELTRVYAITREEWLKRCDTYFDTFCGLSCRDCTYREICNCGGCIASGGHPFHGQCAVAKCAKSRHIRFCGECGEFPCDVLKSYAFDPEQGDNGQRIENCRTIKIALVSQARQGIDPVSVCGHHCDHCFLGRWCGGCRSSYNCCSFAGLHENGVCPNVACADEKGLEGCCDCPELEGCTKGYYSIGNEYAAKAAAMFISKHGKTAYRKTLAEAIAKGMNYAKDLDDAGSVQAALSLLEGFLNEG